LEYCNGRQENCKFPQGICKEFFKFAKLIMKIPNELGTQKRNALRSLPVKPMPISHLQFSFPDVCERVDELGIFK
jgi:hypothetical protein